MALPDQLELLKLFQSFLFEAGLSSVSVKNYLSDLRHFLAFCLAQPATTNTDGLTVKDIFYHIDHFLDPYLAHQKASFTPASTTARRLASIRRFSTFLSVKFGLINIFTAQSVSNNIKKNSLFESHQNISPSQVGNSLALPTNPIEQKNLTSDKILEQFKSSLEKEKKSHSTIKNYLSDLNHFFLWTANETPFTDQNLVNILSDHLLQTYVTYLKLSHTSTSVISRRQSSIKKLAKFCFEQGYLPENPFEIKSVAQTLAPLAWLERFTFKKKKKTDAPKNKIAALYDRYSSLPWSPYFNLALLVLATTTMAILAYNQIINQARPSSAATTLTPPKRQLSFQGRLTDSGGTPITTAVTVVFKLFNALTGPTQLYTTGSCSITPDQDGIFNTLIGDTVCGSEIPSSVFSDNRDVFLEITVGAETLTPRQQIATVGYALNSETLQGYPASAAATINTVPVMNNDGNIVLAQLNPSLVATSSSGTFTIRGDTLALQTNLNSGGDIILQPDALGSGQILALGGTTTEDTFRITNANLTSGSLISGYVGNDLLMGRLISLTSGSTETDRFWVATDGRTSINASATDSALIINQNGSGNLISASVSGSPIFTVTNGGNVDITGQYLINGVPFSGSNWQRTSGSLAPLHITDSINIGAIATGSALIHLAGTAGENSFINTGNLGIGNNSPGQKLDVSGNIQFSGALMPGADAGLTGQYLISSGPGVAPTWTSTITASSLSFADITNGTNNSAAMVVDTGASLNYTNSGTINASSLVGATWVSPGTIGSTTPNTGAFTTLSATGLLSANASINVTGYATVSASLTVNDSASISGALTLFGTPTITTTSNQPLTISAADTIVSGRTTLNSLSYTWPASQTPSYVLQTNGSGILSWVAQTGSGNSSPWDWNTGVIFPFSITDAVNLGNAATASATVHLAGTAGDNSFINTGNFGIGLNNPAYKLDVNGDINLSGGIRASGSFGSSGDILSSTGTGVQWIPAPTSGSGSNWTIANGTIYPNNATLDALIGGNSTASAKFAFKNVSSGTPTASISSQVANVNTYLTGDGTLATTNRNSLTIGNSSTYNTTGNVLINPNGTGNVGIGTTSPNFKLDVSGASNNILNISQAGVDGYLYFAGSNANSIRYSSNELGLYTNQSNGFNFYTSGTNRFKIASNGSIGVGTTSPLATLDVRSNLGTIPVASISGATNQPALLVDQSGTGDIINASSSGQTRFRVTNNGSIYTSLGLGVVHSSSTGLLSSSLLDLATEVTGILPIINGGTNNTTFTSGKFIAYDGTKLASTAFDATSFDAPLTFSNGLTRTSNNVEWGGTLTANTTIAQAGFDVAFTGAGNFGIGVASPSQKLDVAGVFVVDSANGRVGIGTTTPTTVLDIAGLTSTISNSSGDITLNAASGFINFSGNSLNNFLDATLSGRLKLGIYPTVGLPTASAGTLVYDSTANYPVFYNGTSWQGMVSYFSRGSAGILYPTNGYDSINVGGTPSASSSALVRLSSNDSFYSFFYNPLAIGFRSGAMNGVNTMLEIDGDIVPHTTATWSLGNTTGQWQNLYLSNGIFSGSTQVISTTTGNSRLTGGQWNATTAFRVGDTVNSMPSGIELYVTGDASISGTLGVVGNSSLIGNVTIGGGTGKLDVGTVDPPYTINGEKYGTYMASMIGVKEEVMGKVTASEYVNGLGYRALLDLDAQPKGSDLWLFSKTTNIKSNIGQLAVLLTSAGQAKTWYEIDETNKILAIYSSNPTDIIYRLTAPRFDAADWSNTRTGDSIGFVITDPDLSENNPNSNLFTSAIEPELIANADKSYSVKINGRENREVSSFFQSLIANLKVGTQVVTELLADNLTVKTKLISPYADIDSLKVIDATFSGTLYADNIKGKTVDVLNSQLDLLSEKYATASAILADLQAKYTSYGSLFGNTNPATPSSDPLALSPLATTSANIPSDLSLNSLNVNTLYGTDIIASGSLFSPSISSFDTDLFIQPTGDRPVHLLANLMTLYPDGKVVINGDLLITGTIYANGLDTRTATVSGMLALGRGDVATDSGKLITLFDENGRMVGSVDASGSAKFGKLVTDGLVIASGNDTTSASMSAVANTNTTIGTATIATGSSEISILSNKVTDNTLIYVTPITNTANQVLYVKSKQTGVGFTVAVPTQPNQVKQQISFNYWLVETK